MRKILFGITYGAIIIGLLASIWLVACFVIRYGMYRLLGF